MRYTVLPILLTAVWISLSEFLRNEILFKYYWIQHYASKGLTFPSDPINGAVWGLWSLCLAIVVFVVSRRFAFVQTLMLVWFAAFVMMWLVIGNLAVLPYRLLFFAVPLSVLEVAVAAWLCRKLSPV